MMDRVILYKSIKEISRSVTRLAAKVSLVIPVEYSPSASPFFAIIGITIIAGSSAIKVMLSLISGTIPRTF